MSGKCSGLALCILRWSTTLLLATLLSVALLPGQGAADEVARLGSTDGRIRSRAYSRLRADKSPATLVLLGKQLPGFPLHSQTLGLSLVQGFGRERCEPVLRRFLGGKSRFLRLGAAVWFYQRGDHAVESHIVECLRRGTDQVELSSMLSRLGSIRSPAVLLVVQERLTEAVSISVLDPALSLLQRGKAIGAITRVEALLATPGLDADRRALCAAFLISMGQDGHSAALIEAIGQVRSFSRLVNLLRSAGHLEKAVLAAILEFATEQRGYNVRYALQLLARHDYRAGVPQMREMLESEDLETSKAAFDALMRMGDGLQPKQLRRLLVEAADGVALAAADALRRMDDQTGLDRVIGLARTGGKLRLEALSVLGKYRSPKVVPLLLEAMQHADRDLHTRGLLGLQTVFRALFPYRRFDFLQPGFQADSAAQRQALAAQLRSWWNTNAGKK